MSSSPALAVVPVSTRSGLLARVVPWSLVYVGAALLGRLSGDATGVLTLVAPSAGVAVIWFITGDRRTWPWDLTAMGLSSLLVVFLAFPDDRLVFLAVPNTILQVLTYGYVLARLAPFYWSTRRERPLSGGSDLFAVLFASISAGLVGAAVGSFNFWLVMDAPLLPDGLIRLGRNAVAIFLLAAAAGSVPAHLRTWADIRAVARAPHRITTRRLAEVGWLAAVTVAVFGFGFGDNQGRPVGFLLLVPAIWVGMRFKPATGAAFSLACSLTVVVLTLKGIGSFTSIADPSQRAIVAQLLVATLVGITLLLSLTQDALNRAVATVTERNEIVDAALGAIDEGFTIMDEHGDILDRNEAVYRILEDRALTNRVAPAATYGFHRPDGRMLEDGELPFQRAFRGESVEAEEVHLHLGNKTRIVEMTSRVLHQSDPEAPRRAFVLMRDVTRERQETQALTSFAGVVAHDLNGPLAVVTGWAGALLEELEDADTVKAAEVWPMVTRIADAADRMRMLIADLLGYATARNKVPRPESIDLAETIARSLTLRDGPDKVGVADVETVGLDPVWADPQLVLQLVDNLLGNAIKYVAPGVHPHVVVTSRALPDGYVEVSLADNGLGIPAAERPLVFETFHRVQREGYQGTGLGLAICRQIVESHGGQIVADENPGGGTVMRFTLPGSAAAYGARQRA